MSIQTAFATLFLFCRPAISQIVAADCTLPEWDWTFNSLNQTPCTVAAYLQSTCNGSSFTVTPLTTGSVYPGPSPDDKSDLCMCNTVVYSLMSACDCCQGETCIPWPQWATNCTNTLPPSSFPNPVPDGTRVPQWALLDVTQENDWDPTRSTYVGDSPEIGPGAMINGSSSTSTPPNPTAYSTISSLVSSQPSPSSLPAGASSSGGSGSNTGAIVGGVVGGIILLATIAFGIYFYLRRKRRNASSPASSADAVLSPEDSPAVVLDSSSQAHTEAGGKVVLSYNGTVTSPSPPEAPMSSTRAYNPNDPITFPVPQTAPSAPEVSAQATFDPNQDTRDAAINRQASPPPGYTPA